MEYISVIKIAIFVFPIVSIIISLPFLIFHYRKYGSISFFRFLLIYSFFFYIVCTYFLVILPLPSISEVANYTRPYYNLKPFFVVPEIVLSGEFNIIDPDTYVFLFNQRFFDGIFNIIMTIPFGIYMRYYFKCGFFKTMLFSFVLSLFFELTQLSGLYFIYPRPYRLCDINDLINNTFGGVIGYIITPLFSLFLPSRDRIDSHDYLRGKFVSVGRLGVSVFIDYFLIGAISLILFNFIRFKYACFLYLIINFIYFVFIPIIFSGYTFGKWVLKFRNVSDRLDQRVSFLKYFIRWVVVHAFILNGLFLLIIINNRFINIDFSIWISYGLILFLFGISCFNSLIVSKDLFINSILGIKSESVIGLDDFYEI